MSDCLSCSVANLSLSNFGGYNCERSDKDVSIEGLNTDMKSYEWRRDDDSHTKKTLVGVSNNETLVLLNQQIKISKKHIYVKRCQVKHYNELKQNLKSNEIILHVYFSGNYTNHQHQKVQSAYFDHSSFAVFTGCCCLISTDGSLIKESIVVVTESSDHSRITLSDYCISKAVHTLCKIQCTFQCTVNSRKEIAEYADKRVESITTLYSPECKLFVEPNVVAKVLNIPQTLQVDKVRRHTSKNGTLFLEFFCLTSDDKPSLTQDQRKEGDSEIRGHEGMDFKDESHRAKFREAENGSDWLCCLLCRSWFHGDCFYA